jgi:uncharacterized protein (DUF1501 family)
MLTRRRFLIDGVTLTALAPALAGLPFGRARTAGERILVVVQLSGGNDGLNTVVPHRQDAYARARPSLALAADALHRLDDDHGLHPALGELGKLHDEGKLATVHGVGVAQPDRSHFRSLEIWHSADPDRPARGIGWLGRLADQIAARSSGALPALHVGGGDVPLALMGERILAPSLADERALALEELPGLAETRDSFTRREGGGADLAFLRSAARTAYRASRELETVASRATGASYPEHALAQKLRLVARLIAGGFDTRLFHLSLDGFDTHARQAPLHAALLSELGASLSAFQRDLEASGAAPRVVTFVHSEFGRRVEENASRGTDHGAAAPVFLVGGALTRGVFGTAPDLGALVDGDVPATTDFRALYTTLERDWLGLTPSTDVAAFDFGA